MTEADFREAMRSSSIVSTDAADWHAYVSHYQIYENTKEVLGPHGEKR